MLTITSVRKWRAAAIALGFTFLATLLGFGTSIGFAAPVSSATGYTYDASISAYDGVAHSAQAHASEAAPIASHKVSEDVQGTLTDAVGPLSVLFAKSVAANTADRISGPIWSATKSKSGPKMHLNTSTTMAPTSLI